MQEHRFRDWAQSSPQQQAVAAGRAGFVPVSVQTFPMTAESFAQHLYQLAFQKAQEALCPSLYERLCACICN